MTYFIKANFCILLCEFSALRLLVGQEERLLDLTGKSPPVISRGVCAVCV